MIKERENSLSPAYACPIARTRLACPRRLTLTRRLARPPEPLAASPALSPRLPSALAPRLLSALAPRLPLRLACPRLTPRLPSLRRLVLACPRGLPWYSYL